MTALYEVMPRVWALDLRSDEMEARACVVLGDDQALVWDTLTRPKDMAPLKDLLAGRPFHVVYSHGDWDHIWGTAGFEREPLAVIAHRACRIRFDADIPRTLRQRQLAEPGKWDSVRLVPPNITFESFLDLDLGGATLELHPLRGHTGDCIVGWLPELGILLGGDAIESPLPVVNSARRVPAWLGALESWASRDDLETAIPSHGAIEGRRSLELTINYLRALQGERAFELPPLLPDFYRETHQKNLTVMRGGLDLHE